MQWVVLLRVWQAVAVVLVLVTSGVAMQVGLDEQPVGGEATASVDGWGGAADANAFTVDAARPGASAADPAPGASSPRGATDAVGGADVPEAVADRARDAVALSPLLDELLFYPNDGAWPEHVAFGAPMPGGWAYVTAEGLVLESRSPAAASGHGLPPDGPGFTSSFQSIAWGGPGRVVGVDPADLQVRSYHGSDASAWSSSQAYHRVIVEGVAPGVDVVVRASPDGRVEFDHVLAPGADPADVALRFPGSSGLRLADGRLHVEGPAAFALDAPMAFQDIEEGRAPVEVGFRITGDEVRYDVGAYDASVELTIDPIVRVASLLGTSSTDYGRAVAVADDGLASGDITVYVGAYAYGSLIPKVFSVGLTHGSSSGYSVMVAKMHYDADADLLKPVFVVRYGGSSTDSIYGLAARPGHFAVVGYTQSDNLPVVNPINDAGYDGSSLSSSSSPWSWLIYADVFLAEFDDAGALGFSSYLGGGDNDYAYDVAYNDAGHIALTGYTSSTDFPTKNAYDAARSSTDAFVAVVDPVAATFDWSTYFGGTSTEYGYGIDADATGVYVAGYTSSTSFPTTPGSYMPSPGGGLWGPNAGWAARFLPDGSDLVWSTFLDGSSTDYAQDLVADGTGGAWVVGYSQSGDFPTCPADCPAGAQEPLQSGHKGGYDVFVTHLDDVGDGLWSSFYGGTSWDYGQGIAVAANGKVAFAGYTVSSDFPLVRSHNSAIAGSYDGFMVSFDPSASVTAAGAQVEVSSLVGAPSSDYFYDMDADDQGSVYAVGMSYGSGTFPDLNAIQKGSAGSYDAMLGILGKAPPNVVVSGVAGLIVGNSTDDDAMEVLTFVEVEGNALKSKPGDLPIDTSAGVDWTFEDASGNVLKSGHGDMSGPPFGAVTMPDDVTTFLCAQMYDISPPGTAARVGKGCLQIDFLNRDPVASFYFPNDLAAINTDLWPVDESTDRDGTIVDWEWRFHDGTVSHGRYPSYQYEYTGYFPVTLTVTDDDEATGSYTRGVEVEVGPTAHWLHDGDPVKAGERITFTDDSEAGWRPIETWSWDFGDGVLNDGIEWPAPVAHAWEEPGVYPVKITVDDGRHNDTYVQDVAVVPAQLTALDDAYTVIEGQTLQVPALRGLLANDFHPLDHEMEVASHTLLPGLSVDPDTGSFTYAAGVPGTVGFEYVATDGHTSSPAKVTIEVVPFPPPVADFVPRLAGRDIVLTDLSRPSADTRPLVAWSWTFGDEETSAEREPIHAYAQPGVYTVTLRVTDSSGASASAAKTVHIVEEPRPPEAGVDAPIAVAAAPPLTRSGQLVILDGTASRPDGLHYEWTVLDGDVRLHDADDALATFTAPETHEPTTLSFQLRVYDGITWSEPDVVSIDVAPGAGEPDIVLDRAKITVRPGERVFVPVHGDEVPVQWSQEAGPQVALEPGHDLAFFAPLEEGLLVFRAMAGHDTVTEATVEVQVVAEGPARPDFTYRHISTGRVLFEADVPDDVGVTWDFGDGSATSHARVVEHLFAGSGPFRVTLSVTDAEGLSAHVARDIPVAVVDIVAPSTTEKASPDAVPAADVAQAPLPLLVALAGLVAAVAMALRRRS